MKLATWNVQGLRTKQEEVFLELQKMRIDVCVLTEVKRKGRGSEMVGDYVHIFSGVAKDDRARRGVAIAVHKNLKKNIRSWEEVDEQIIKLEMIKNGRHIVIIGVYAPSEDSDKITKDHFYNILSDTLSDIKDNKEIFILGDLNGRTGRENDDPVVGRYGEIVLNNNGQRLRSFCQSSSLKIMNGYFPHKDIHKFTWIQPTKGLRSIIDYVIQKQNSTLKTIDVRVYRSAECGSDHHMLVAKIFVNYRKTNTTTELKKREELDSAEDRRYNLRSNRSRCSFCIGDV